MRTPHYYEALSMGPSVIVLMRFDCNLDDSDDMELIEKVSQHGTYELA